MVFIRITMTGRTLRHILYSEFVEKASRFEVEVNKKIKRGMKSLSNKHPLITDALEASLHLLPPPFNVMAESIYNNFQGSEEEKLEEVKKYLREIQTQGEAHFKEISSKLSGINFNLIDLKNSAAKESTLLQIKEIIISNSIAGDERRREHQKKDIRPIFECWQNFFVYPVQFIYGSNYPECFEGFYSEIFNRIRGCDPHDEAMMHLKTGYYESTFKKYISLKNKVIKHNRKVARYVIKNEKDTKNSISDNIPKLKECGINEQLRLNSYYVSNVITHLRNIARGAQIILSPKPECANDIDGYALYSNGGIRLAFGSKENISKLSSFLEGYSECFTKEYKKVRLRLDEINRLLSDFRGSIHPLIPKAKYGHLNGKCEFEVIDTNV
jgi:hypothetical protein